MARDYATLKNSPLSRVKGQHSKLLVTFPNGSAVVGTRSTTVYSSMKSLHPQGTVPVLFQHSLIPRLLPCRKTGEEPGYESMLFPVGEVPGYRAMLKRTSDMRRDDLNHSVGFLLDLMEIIFRSTRNRVLTAQTEWLPAINPLWANPKMYVEPALYPGSSPTGNCAKNAVPYRGLRGSHCPVVIAQKQSTSYTSQMYSLAS